MPDVKRRYAVFLVILVASTFLSFSGFVARANPASYTVQAQDKDGTWTPGLVSGYVGCENVPFRLIGSYKNPDQGDTVTIMLVGASVDSAGNKGIDYMGGFDYSDPGGLIDAGPTVDTHSLPWAGGSGTGTLQPPDPTGVRRLAYTLTFELKSSFPNNDIVFTWWAHLALSPSGAAEWVGPPPTNIQAGADPPSGGVKTVNIRKPASITASTTMTTTSTTTSTSEVSEDTTMFTSSTSQTTETSVTNPTTTRTFTTTVTGSQPTTYTSATTYTTSWTRNTFTSQVGTTTSVTEGVTTISALTGVTTTSTTTYTTTGSTVSGTVYQTVVTQYYVREGWLETIIDGVITLITRIYNLIFEIKVDPTVDQTIVIVTTSTTSTPPTAPVGGTIATVNKQNVLAPYLLLLLLSAVLMVLIHRRQETLGKRASSQMPAN